MRRLKRILSFVLTAILIAGMVAINPIDVRAEEPGKTITIKLSCSGDLINDGQVPEVYGIDITVHSPSYDSGKQDYRLDGGPDGDLVTVDIPVPENIDDVIIRVDNPGTDIGINGEIDNSWGEGKTLLYSDINDNDVFNFVLQRPSGEPGGEGPGSLPDELFTEQDGRFYLTITDSNKDEIAAYNSFRIPAGHELTIATSNFAISGNIDFDFDTALNINKGCKITAAEGVNIWGTIPVKLGDKNALEGLGLDVKIKKTGDPEYYPFDKDTIDDTVFEYSFDAGCLVYKEGSDNGFCMNSNGTCKSEDWNTQYGIVEYKVTTDGEVVASGTFTEDWKFVDLPTDKFKAGSEVQFTVKAFEGKKLQTNGVRFPDNKTCISTLEEEAKAGTTAGCVCSYVLTDNPEGYLVVTVDFISEGEELTTADFEWSYDSNVLNSDGGFDKYVSHGTIEVMSAKVGTTSVTNSNNPDEAPYWTKSGEVIHASDGRGNNWDEMRGRFNPGTKVTVRLIPDRGYQLTSFTISNIPGTTTPIDGVNEYTFVLNRPDYYHLAAVFSPVADEVDATGASGVSGGNVSFAAGEVEKGTVALNVNDASANPTEEARFEKMASDDGYTVNKTLNISAEQRFYKGVEHATRSQCWVQEIPQELSAPAEIELNVSGIGTNVAILHNHNGSYEVIPATYSGGKLRFSTDSFSDFAIISKASEPKKEQNDKSSGSDENTQTPAAQETVGSVVGGTSVKNWEELDKILVSKSTLKADVNNKKKVNTKNNGQLIQLVLKNSYATVPASTFAALASTNDQGLHLFTGGGTAITFMNDSKLTNQKAINLASIVVETKGKKTVEFKQYAKLSASTIMHSTVPAGTKKVTIYSTGKDGVRRLCGTVTPTAKGLFFFAITELSKYEFVY